MYKGEILVNWLRMDSNKGLLGSSLTLRVIASIKKASGHSAIIVLMLRISPCVHSKGSTVLCPGPRLRT